MKNPYGFENAKDILNGVVGSLGVERGLKQSTVINFWKSIVGPRFQESSKAASVIKKNGKNILVVATSSSVVSQELSLYKRELLKKLYPLSKSLKFVINDIIFSTKSWSETEEKIIATEKSAYEVYEREPTQQELDQIELPESIVESVRESMNIEQLESDERKKRMFVLVINDLKLQIWKKNNGFPFCSKCGIPVNHKYFGQEKVLCPSCKNL